MFEESGIMSPITAASGAQKGFMGVAVRLAMSSCLRVSFPTVILDEPTESMSEDNALRLSSSLLASDQVILITHKISDNLVSSNIIEI